MPAPRETLNDLTRQVRAATTECEDLFAVVEQIKKVAAENRQIIAENRQIIAENDKLIAEIRAAVGVAPVSKRPNLSVLQGGRDDA
jgi:hypothetical protein